MPRGARAVEHERHISSLASLKSEHESDRLGFEEWTWQSQFYLKRANPGADWQHGDMVDQGVHHFLQSPWENDDLERWAKSIRTDVKRTFSQNG